MIVTKSTQVRLRNVDRMHSWHHHTGHTPHIRAKPFFNIMQTDWTSHVKFTSIVCILNPDLLFIRHLKTSNLDNLWSGCFPWISILYSFRQRGSFEAKPVPSMLFAEKGIGKKNSLHFFTYTSIVFNLNSLISNLLIVLLLEFKNVCCFKCILAYSLILWLFLLFDGFTFLSFKCIKALLVE
jgi:hypothetical protein